MPARVALVTGSGKRRVGAAVADALARAGYAVAVHYLSSAAGIGLLFIALVLGGLIQGFRLNETTADVVRITRGTIPFIGLATLGFLSLLVGQCAFLKNLFTLMHRQASPVRAAAVGLFIPETERSGGKP